MRNYWFDKFAIGISMLCALQCIALPIVLIALPSLSTMWIGDEAFHQLLLWFVIPTSVLAVALGYRRHQKIVIAAVSALGLLILMIAALIGHDAGPWAEKLLTLCGSIILIFSHWRNLRASHHALEHMASKQQAG